MRRASAMSALGAWSWDGLSLTIMSTASAKPRAGLEDIVATSSAICYLDGERGVLAYCGYDIHDLARHATFEEVCYLLWHRRLPTRAELADQQ
jgi:citrate synthase